jgi:endonuclease G, mitochondrial
MNTTTPQPPPVMTDFSGYSELFLDQPVPLPRLTTDQQADLAPVQGTTDHLARYANYSVALSRSRKFPFFTASNIDGGLFKKASRSNNWRKDPRIEASHQWGSELYSADHSDFDKGHMVKREDVQWGNTQVEAQQGADSTFFYTNAVPQHARLNQQIWADLEDYILHTESVGEQLKISVFTGPVLGLADPEFVTDVKDQTVRLPILFWKVVVFTRRDGTLCRVGFLMGQKTLLTKHGIVRPSVLEVVTEQDDLFLKFEEADTFQVNLATIETLTGITMPIAEDLYRDDRPIQLITEVVDTTQESFDPAGEYLGFRIPNLVL